MIRHAFVGNGESLLAKLDQVGHHHIQQHSIVLHGRQAFTTLDRFAVPIDDILP